jgi:excisionase family DNA binding protein
MAMLGTAEAATRLGISARRVSAMIQNGQLRAMKIGKTWIIEEAEIVRLAKMKRQPGRPRKQK